jgi:hypothetical protein
MNNLALLAGGTRAYKGAYVPSRASRKDLGITLSDQWCNLLYGDFNLDESWFPWTTLWNVANPPTPLEVGSLLFCPPEKRALWYRSAGTFRLLSPFCAGINGVALFDYARRIGIEQNKVHQVLVEELRQITLDYRWRKWAVNPHSGYSLRETRRQVEVGIGLNAVPRVNHIDVVYTHNDLERYQRIIHGLDEAEQRTSQGWSGYPIHGLTYRNLQRLYVEGHARKLNVRTGIIASRADILDAKKKPADEK